MQTCLQCHVGHLHKKHIPYANWHASEFVVVQNMPAWQCDVCAYCELDAEVINRLLPLLGPVTRPDPTQPRRVLKSTAPTDPLHDEVDPDHDRRRA
jgi:YgiT-type zinc finger domain-containing protein